MPNAVAPTPYKQVDIDAPWVPYIFSGQSMDDAYARELVDRTLFRLEMWRAQNNDPRWRLNEWLYYGYVPPKVWDGTSIPRSSIPWPLSFYQVEGANAKLYQELLASDELIGVTPEGQTHPLEAQQIKDRLLYIFDHNIDDEGWTARKELKLCLKDLLIYGNCFGIVEWDGDRRQGFFRRLDPRDVYVDMGSNSPNISNSRCTIVRQPITVNSLEAMRDFKSFRIPSKEQIAYIAQYREYMVGDRSKSTQEAARGVRYQPVVDDWLPNPSSRFMDIFVYMGQGREIWMLGKGPTGVIIYNEPFPYGCSRVISAPCFTVPNRFYAQSYVDVIDPFQQIGTALINRHLDELALALNPPRATKRGAIRTPSSMAWRPGLVSEFDNPKEDNVIYQTQGITENVWQTINWVKGEAETMVGQNSLSSQGSPTPSNANRTRGGMQMQLQPPMERLSEIADNFEQYMLVPLCYKLLKVEHVHTIGEKNIYGKRNASLPPGTAPERPSRY